MDVQEHVEDKHNYFKERFQLLTLVQVHDDVTYSENS